MNTTAMNGTSVSSKRKLSPTAAWRAASAANHPIDQAGQVRRSASAPTIGTPSSTVRARLSPWVGAMNSASTVSATPNSAAIAMSLRRTSTALTRSRS